MKIPIKDGTTRIVPKINQGILFPHGVLSLSLANPTRVVATPSKIYPISKLAAVISELSSTTCVRYQEKYIHHMTAVRSLKT